MYSRYCTSCYRTRKGMIKPIISGLLLIMHIACILVFCSLSMEYKLEHKAICIVLFYGSSLILTPINNIIIDCEDVAYRIGIYHAQNLFCMVIGTIYVMHYTGLYITNYLNVAIFCSCFLTIFTIIFYNLIRYGLLKNNGSRNKE